MSELKTRLREEMQGEHASPHGHDRLLARVGRRERRRRVAAGALGLVLTALIVVSGYVTLRNDRGSGGSPPPASGAPTTAPTPVGSSPSDHPDPTPSPTVSASDEPTTVPRPGAPPPVTVRFFDRSVQLAPYVYCYRTWCINGSAPANPPDVGSPEFVTVEFPLPGWSFTAYFSPAGDRCGRVQSARLTPADDGTLTLRPVGYADTYDVTLFARGDGDLSVAFRWATPTEGPLPKPSASLAILSNDDPVTSYGIELVVTNLASTPSSARAMITVRAANGREITFEAEAAEPRPCFPEGTLYWLGPDAKGLAAAQLGDPPFTYEVELVLDGIRYFATAIWPRDEIKGNEPSVKLTFSPSLPAL